MHFTWLCGNALQLQWASSQLTKKTLDQRTKTTFKKIKKHLQLPAIKPDDNDDDLAVAADDKDELNDGMMTSSDSLPSLLLLRLLLLL